MTSKGGAVVRVLLVEDEVHLAEAVQRGLAAEGFQVELSHDGHEGLLRAKTGGFDALVLDIMLPGLSGYRICQELRKAGVWTPILMLTAKDGEHDEADAFDIGADDYLTKPFSYVVLVARLRSLVRRGAPERPAVLVAGDLSLDPSRHRVVREGVELKLTPKEFSLLHHLMRNRDQVLTKVDILDNVWDLHYGGDENIVEVYIGYLRKKIDAPFGRRSIETVRGVGYRLLGTGG
jgi:DNA-binding response OmpR family regulator